jgi:hypothetical protein
MICPAKALRHEREGLEGAPPPFTSVGFYSGAIPGPSQGPGKSGGTP